MNREPWKEYPNIWKTESAFLSFIRGGIRRHLWSKNPVKLEFVKKARIKIANPVAKNRARFPTVWGGQCELCGLHYALKDMEVDHKTGEHSLKEVSDIQKFVEGIVFVSEDDLALLCKPCHKVKTLAERQGMSLNDAAITKEAINICKGKADAVKYWLTERGVVPGKTVSDRRKQVENQLRKEKQ